MLGKMNHAVLFAALKEDLWFCNKRITSTCWVPCPLGLLRCRDWIDRLRCLTSKSGLAARATDADLFQGLKCPWHGVILPAQARMLSKMGFLLTYFGCRVVHSIANSRLLGSFWAVSLWFLSLQTLLVVGSYVVLVTISGKKKTAPAQHREYLGSQVKVGDIDRKIEVQPALTDEKDQPPHHRQDAPDSFLGNVRRRCLSHLWSSPSASSLMGFHLF